MLLKALKCEAQNLQIKLIWFWFISQFNSHPIWNTHCKKDDFNPLHPIISMQVLHTALSTFPLVLTRRICQPIKSFLNLWSLILYSFDRNLLFRDDTVGRNKMLFSFRRCWLTYNLCMRIYLFWKQKRAQIWIWIFEQNVVPF